ncbi:MAG TPA: ABC transporter ATP-binding protein [Candidatus Dormibacteraeota bacterium]
MRPGDDDPVAVATLREDRRTRPAPAPPQPRGARPPLVEARGIWKEYPGKRGKPPRVVIRGVNLRVGVGRAHCVMGLSGAGKSTLVGMLAGLLMPTRGTVDFQGAPATPEMLRHQVALSLGIDGGFYGRLSVHENLEFFGALIGMPRPRLHARADEVLGLVGLRRAAEADYRTLSSGQRRQAHLARALLVQRPFLIADEPTRGLDPATEQRIVDLLYDVKKSGQAMLVVTHDVHLASGLADWVSVLDAGIVIKSDSPLDLLHLLASTRIYLRFQSDPARAVERLRKLAGLTELHAHDLEVHCYTQDPERDLNQVIRIVVEEGLEIAQIEVPEPGLEEVFLKVIAERKHQAALRRALDRR